ncbi:MAG: hypothetical protein HY842_09980 [Bacteroidetes bacterium]|nr:hypothetical protein [Bacteroidota bacterium]
MKKITFFGQKKREPWPCFTHLAATANRRLCRALQVLLLFATMQANAINHFPGIPFFWQLLAKASNTASMPGHEVPTTCDYDPCNMAMVADCGFLVTSVTIESNGIYKICVQANDQNSPQSWVILNFPTQTSNDPSPCWTIATSNPSPFFFIQHIIGGSSCTLTVGVATETGCPTNVVTSEVTGCPLQTAIGINLSLINTPYVITFGDGSLAEQSSSNQVVHSYGQPGTYYICLTFTVPEPEPSYITCCYPIQVTSPPFCTCPEDVVSIVSVVPCTWVASLNFDLLNFPITVDYGDGTSPEVVTGPSATHDFPDNITYNVCYTFEPVPGSTLTCCELVSLPQCCLDAGFTIAPDYANGWESCYNPEYKITPNANCQGSPLEVQHLWEFPDGETSTDPFPPNQIFTDFAHAGALICVKHTVTCCDETDTEEVCFEHFPAAYIGTSGGVTNLSDLIPTTGQTVLQFIQQNANNSSLPLLIDGQLNINVANAIFSGGTWNMGRNSEIVVMGTNSVPRRDFVLSGTTIQSAVRLDLPLFAACCRWRGIRSEMLTYVNLNGATVMDANYAIHYPSFTVGSPFPFLRSINSTYENNFYAIKSVRQHVVFPRFQGNTLNGTTLLPQHVCGCTAENAIDFRNVGATSIVSINDFGQGTNQILNYERGFNFQNTQLNVRGFNIHDLRDFPTPSPGVPTNTAGETAIGIDFFWNTFGASRLDLDRVSFTDFDESGALSYAVRDRVSRGNHTLLAAAATLGSISTAGIAGGYDISVFSPGIMVSGSTIHQNTINTDGSSTSSSGSGFGITGNFTSAGNILRISDNHINVSSGSGNPMNGGIVLTSTEDLTQPFAIEHTTPLIWRSPTGSASASLGQGAIACGVT